MKDNKLNIGQCVLVYKGTPTYENGAVCVILDRDPNDNSYAVATLEEVGLCEGSNKKLLQRFAKWVDRSNLDVISFERKQNLLDKLKGLFTFRKDVGTKTKGKNN